MLSAVPVFFLKLKRLWWSSEIWIEVSWVCFFPMFCQDSWVRRLAWRFLGHALGLAVFEHVSKLLVVFQFRMICCRCGVVLWCPSFLCDLAFHSSYPHLELRLCISSLDIGLSASSVSSIATSIICSWRGLFDARVSAVSWARLVEDDLSATSSWLRS